MSIFTIAIREFVDGYNYFIQKVRHRLIKKFSESVLQNLDIINAIEGAKSSAIFEKKYLKNCKIFKTRKNLFEHCLNNSNLDGLYLEFGVYKGNSINQLAKIKNDKHFYGFDSFVGLPENWTIGCRQGSFNVSSKLPAVRDNVTLIKGFFNETLPNFITQHTNKKISFLHIDCDLYSSTKTILEELRPLLHKGTVICFDEYYNYSDWEEGEYKAFIEFTNKYNINFEYLGYIRIGSQVAVRIS